jgi:RecB family endonuclease NucS
LGTDVDSFKAVAEQTSSGRSPLSRAGPRAVSLVSPQLTECRDLINDGIAKQKVLILAGNCTVKYEGRAASKLTWGERVLVIKADGSVLIHRRSGYEPVNWQPPKCQFRVSLEDGKLLSVLATRQKPKESLRLLFDDITVALALTLTDEGEFAMHVTEEQMKQAIMLDPSLVELGLKLISEETKMGDSGFTDVYAEDSEGRLVVIEIKRNPASREAALQLNRYVETLRKRVSRPVRGILAAPELRSGTSTLLARLGYDFKAVSPEKCFQILRPRTDTRLSEFLQ